MAGKNKLDGAQMIVDYLICEKVPYAFGLCGHVNIGFIDALYGRADEIKTISVHHETVAGSWRMSITACPASPPRPPSYASRKDESYKGRGEGGFSTILSSRI